MGKYVRPSQINQVTRWTGRSLAVLFTTITLSACTNGNTGTGTNMPPSVTPVTSPLGSSLPRDTSATPASSTQLLTGLRNSRVIKDTGKLVVGWSTLGSTAVITVVDNEKGLVMQQMVSTDTVDPTKRIYQLGLADESETSEVMETTEEEQPEQ